MLFVVMYRSILRFEINHLTPLTQYYGPVWLADVLSANNIELMEINSLSQYSLLHDISNYSYGLP